MATWGCERNVSVGQQRSQPKFSLKRGGERGDWEAISSLCHRKHELKAFQGPQHFIGCCHGCKSSKHHRSPHQSPREEMIVCLATWWVCPVVKCLQKSRVWDWRLPRRPGSEFGAPSEALTRTTLWIGHERLSRWDLTVAAQILLCFERLRIALQEELSRTEFVRGEKISVFSISKDNKKELLRVSKKMRSNKVKILSLKA